MATSTLGSGTVVLAGTTSGTTTVTATAVAGTTTLTLPAATDTLVGKATTDTLTNKTLTSATLTGVVTFDAGTAAAPAITTTGDTNTGIFFPAADTIAFSEGGVEAVRIDSSGRLGIGTNSPTQLLTLSNGATPRLSIKDTRASVDMQVLADNVAGYSGTVTNYPYIFVTNNAEAMRIDSSGNVGIGTSSVATNFRTQFVGTAGSNTSAASSGTTQAASAILRLQAGGGFTGTLDIGQGGGTGSWLQSTDTSNLATTYPLLLNPAGGNVLVGTTNASPTAGAGMKFIISTDPANPVFKNVVADGSGAYSTYNLYSTNAGAYRFFVTTAGVVNATSATITAISDQRFKENIRDLDDGLEKVLALKPRKFDWKENKGENIKNARGFIAQELETVFPDMISNWIDEPPEGEEPYKAVNANLIPTLVKAIQEQQALIQSLTTRLTALEAK
jgi:hypothetical protein